MRHDKFSKQNVLLYCLGTIPVVWLALRIAPFMKDGLLGLIQNFDAAMSRPFHIMLCEDSSKTVLVLLLCYGLAIGIYLSTQRNYRRREEHGSARWGSPAQVSKKYADRIPSQNKILTQNVSVGLDGRKHRRNLNTLVCGGSGAGKTRFFAKPNLCQANSSYVVLDPKGELLRDTGNLLSAKGYDIKVLDLINMERSHCYNPFVYLRSDNDIQRLVTNLFKNTTPKGSQSQDPFWDQAATMLLLALIFYLHYEAPPEEQNFPMVMEMIRAGEVREDDETYKSALDILFERLEMRNPEHIALKYYRSYHSGSGKTLKSIQITLISRLEKFNLESLASITQNDELKLWSIGEKKTAVFAIIPDNDSSFSFLVGMLYTQLFQQLYYQADVIHGGRLPVHVHFLMDEFANVALPDEFDKLLSTMRSREISVSIIIQNLAQLKEEAQMIESGVLLRYIRIFSELTNQLKYATQKRVLLEVTLIKLCKPQMESTKDSLLDRIRALEKQVEEGSFAVAQPQERVVYVNGEAPKPQPKPQLPKALKEDIKQVTSNFRKIANEASGMLRGYLKQARLSVDNQDRLLIVLPDEISASVVGSEEHKQELKDLIEKKIGKTVEIDVRQVENGRHFEDSFVDIEKVINMEITIEDE